MLKSVNDLLLTLNFMCLFRNLNQLSLKYRWYPKSIKMDVFGQKYAYVTTL